MRYLLLAVLLLPSLLSSPACAQTACNGHPELCGRKYSNVTQIGIHDSAFVGSLPADNQAVSVTAQLDAGIRFLQAQSHLNPFKSLSLCHTSCYLEDAGSVEACLATIKSWLDAHPNEVVTVLLTNDDNVDISLFDTAFSVSGIKSYAFMPPTSPLALESWPTLQELITANTRIVAFLNYGVNPFTPYILDEFVYFFEIPYDTTDPSFAECTLDRPLNAFSAGRMFILNHFLDVSVFGVLVPDNPADAQINATTEEGSIGVQTGLCERMYRIAPKAVLVDLFDRGDVFTAERGMNGL